MMHINIIDTQNHRKINIHLIKNYFLFKVEFMIIAIQEILLLLLMINPKI